VNKFAERLLEALQNKDITQRAFAKKLNITAVAVNKWCKGTRQPDIDMLILIAKTLSESIDWLVGLVD
jgi:transcriptional regulator with XRE-family HTH domain